MRSIPSILYLGHEKLKRIKITPLPPEVIKYERHGEYHQWAQGGCEQCKFSLGSWGLGSYGVPMDCGFILPEEIKPYSIRSFLIQLALLNDFPCKYFLIDVQKDRFGNVHWIDGCMKSCGGTDYSSYMRRPCFVSSGFIQGEHCEGWEYIKNLCQTKEEQMFLEFYFRLNHDRESPMLIPQPYLDIREEVRPDFVMFIPSKNSGNSPWIWLAIEIEGKLPLNKETKNKRMAVLRSYGYEGIYYSIKPRILDEARKLYTLMLKMVGEFTNIR